MTLVVQALTAMALAVPSVLAPVAAADVGVAPARVGVWAGMAFLTAMFAGLAFGTVVGSYGPVRMFQPSYSRFLWLPRHVSTRMVWCGVFSTMVWICMRMRLVSGV